MTQTDGAIEPPHGGRAALAISLIALIFSAISLYETVLKTADVKYYTGSVMHYGRDPITRDNVFAVPLTIVNNGARDAVVTELTLRVRDSSQSGAAAVVFRSTYIGGNPAKEKEPFTPISVPGRGSHNNTFLFYPAGRAEGLTDELKAGKTGYHFCLSGNAEAAQTFLDAISKPAASALSFDGVIQWLNDAELNAGKVLPVDLTNVQRYDARESGQAAPLHCN